MTGPHNTILTYALLAVAVTIAAMVGFSWWLISLLSGPDWCIRAMGADSAATGATRSQESVDGCLGLLSQQVSALAINSHMAIGTLALSLLVLVVIVLAGGRMSFKGSKDGVEGSISGDAPAAAQLVADVVQAAADVVKDTV